MIKRTSLFRAVALFLPLIAVAAQGAEQFQAPVLRSGNCWKFKISSKPPSGVSFPNKPPDGTFILRLNKNIQVLEIIDQKEIPSDQRGSILRLLGFPRQGGPQSPLLQFPLYVGKEWQYSVKYTLTHTVNVKVVSEERVATQAGIFQALRIERTRQYATANPRWGTGIVTIGGAYFYSPETKSIVKYDTEGDDGSAASIALLAFESSNNNQSCWAES